MSTASCIAKVTKSLGVKVFGDITPEKMISNLEEARAKLGMDEGNLSGKELDDQVIITAIAGMLDDMGKRRVVDAMELQTISAGYNFIIKEYSHNIVAGLKSLLVGDLEQVKGSRGNAVSMKQKQLHNEYNADYIGALKRAQLWDEVRSGLLDEEMILAARYLDNPDSAEKSALLKTIKNQEAIKAAKLIRTVAEKRREALIRQGVDVPIEPGRLAMQFHDQWKVHRASMIVDPSLSKVTPTHIRGGTQADVDAWVNFTYGELDLDATYRRVRVPEEEGGGMGRPYENRYWDKDKNIIEANVKEDMATIHKGLDDGFQDVYTLSDPLKTSRDTFNPSRALEGERFFKFTPKGEVNYIRKFGQGTVHQSVMAEIQKTSHRLGLMQTLGLNPLDNLRAIVSKLDNTITPADPGHAAFKTYTAGFDGGSLSNPIGRHYSEISGANNRVVSDIGALLGSSLRVFEYMTKLGMSAVSSVGDIGNAYAEIRRQRKDMPGGDMFTSMRDAILSPYEGFTSADVRAISESVGIGMDVMLGSAFHRFGTVESLPGQLSTLMNQYFKWNGLGFWTDAARRGLYATNAHFMATTLKNGTLLGKNYSRMLGAYNIGKKDLAFVKEHLPMYKAENGKEYFNTAGIKEMPLSLFAKKGDDELLTKHLMSLRQKRKGKPSILSAEEMQIFGGLNSKSVIQDLQLARRDNLHQNFHSFFLDRNDFGVLTPGASTDSLIHHGMGRGEAFREILQTFFQFKSYGWEMVTRLGKSHFIASGRETSLKGYAQKMYREGEMVDFAAHISVLTAFGAMTMTMKDMAKGRKPSSPMDEGYWQRAFLHGGAMGLYGDFVIGEHNSLIDFAGAGVSDIAYTFGLGKKITYDKMRGDKWTKQDGAKLYNKLHNALPYGNVFYVKMPLDYLILYGAVETVSPGFLAREERAVKRMNEGKGYWLSPDVVPYNKYGGLRNLVGE